MKSFFIASILGLVVASSMAFAHGDMHSKKAEKTVKAEQKAFGIAGDAKTVSRTIEVDMSDAMRFTPNALSIKQGETIRFVVKNTAKMMHEMVIGTPQELKEHAELMRKFPDMEHSEPYMAHVKPAGKEEIIWTFNKPGEFQFACLIPGHFEAGMVGAISVK
ncbi:MAG TPA: cupredoxin family protein [Burkholderiales bacterium]|jgi:uncharacterized cupredoxin-like copper-binding protein|nr:cupredoxin family protein [Burkholderiales bacterium]